MYELKIYREDLSHDNEECCKIWREIDMKNLTNFDPSIKNFKNFHFNRLLLTKVNNVWVKESIGELFLMELNIDATFEEKLTCAFKKWLRNLVNFHQSMFGSLKLGLWWNPFIYRRCMSLKSTGEVCVMTMKNDAKIKEEFTCQFKIHMRNLKNFDLSTRKSQKFAL